MRVLPTPIPILVLLAGTSAVLASGARAQIPVRSADGRPLIVHLAGEPVRSSRPLAPLTGAQMARFQEAQVLRAKGLLDKARAVLVALDKEAPHHPMVVTELAQLELDEDHFAAVEKLARAERLATKDSLLLGHELALALERLGRPRDAATIALEVWIAGPADAEWASNTIQRLMPTDTRGIRATVRKAAERIPARSDLALGLARLDWQAGDADAAQRAVAAADRVPRQPSARWTFADALLATGVSRDTTGAIDALLALSAETTRAPIERLAAARRAWMLSERRGADSGFATRVQQALKDVPPAQWDPQVLLAVARDLRRSGRTDEARGLLAGRGQDPALSHTVTLERALADLRDGPPEKALPALEAASGTSLEALQRFADALFFAGLADSALVKYQEVAKQPQSPFAGGALERIYLIEDAQPREALPTFGRMAYEEWRGNGKIATTIAESLYRALPRGPLWAQAAVMLSTRREAAGDARAALEPMLAVADSLPADRLAPVARQRAGDLYLTKLKDPGKALAQYEECLARYPRAWNAAEVRRRVEQLRRRL